MGAKWALGVLVVLLAFVPAVVSDTATDGWNLPRQYGGTQGTNNWFYYGAASSPASLSALTYDNYVDPWGTQTFNSWNGGSRYLEIAGRDPSNWVTPGQGAWMQEGEYGYNEISVAWRAPQSGTVYIYAMMQTAYANADSASSSDDGIYFSIWRGTTQIVAPQRVFRGNNEGNRVDHVVVSTSTMVTMGDMIHFYVARGNWQDADGMYYSYTVTYNAASDLTAPVTTYTVNEGVLTLTATDAGGSGVATTEYQRYYPSSGSWTKYTGPINCPSGTSKYMVRSIDNMGNVEAYSRVTVVAPVRPPVAEANGPYLGVEGNVITFTASGSSDPNGYTLQYRWDLNGDGAWDTAYSTSPTATYTYGDEGVKNVRVEAYNGYLTSVDTATATIGNAAPRFTSISGLSTFNGNIIATTYSGQIYYIGINGETLTTPQSLGTISYGCYGAGMGDFDGDGDMDVLVGDSTGTYFYRKTGSGNNFATPVKIDATTRNYRMDFAEADYNGDGKLDAVMADYGSNYLTIYLGNGDGTFTKSTMTATNNLIGLDTGDFNGDGKMDLAAANWGYNQIIIYLGNGDGTFTFLRTINASGTWGVSVSDFNNDGKMDIITGRPSVLLRGNGDGSFQSAVSAGISVYAYGLADEDANGDGKQDLIFTDGNNVYYYKGNGAGAFTASSQVACASNLYSVAVDGTAETKLEGTPITVTAYFADAGWLDTHSVSVDWGDGSQTQNMAVTEENGQPDSTGTGVATHTYGDNGVYTLTFTVRDDDGGIGTTTATVKLSNVAPVAEAGAPVTGDEGTPTVFDASATRDPGYSDVLTYSWDFGDGSPVESGVGLTAPTHTYAENGAYIARLTVTDDEGASSADTVPVNISNVAPTPDAGPDVTTAETQTVIFTGTASDPGVTDALTYEWDLDYDGVTFNVDAIGPSVDHSWPDDWTGIVALRVTDDDSGVGIDTALVTITNLPPVADAGDDQTADEGEPVSFAGVASDPSPTGTVVCEWSFGDGEIAVGTLTPEHTYAENGVYTVTLRVTDDDGAITEDTLTVTVNNVAPKVEAGLDLTTKEGDENNFAATFIDPGTLDTHTITWDFGDGETVEGTLTPTHVYKDNGEYTVTITVTDDDGGVGTGTLQVTVENVAPVAEAGEDQTADEGAPVSFTGAFTDVGVLDTCTVSWSFGDGSTDDSNTLTPTHAYGHEGVYVVTLTVTDKDGGVGTDTLTVTIANLPPTAEAGDDQTGNEGQNLSFAATLTDPGTLDTHVAVWDFGDGSTSTGMTATHAYGDNGIYTVTLTITDDGGLTATDTLQVTAANVAPTVNAGADRSGRSGESVAFSGIFIDPGTLDTHTVTWDFGDGGTATGTLTPEHTYMKAGTYIVTLTVTDDDTGVGVDTLTVTMTNRKLEARTLLLASKTGQRDVDIVIDAVVSLIDKSLNKEYWIDDLHLVEKHGVKVFNYEALATGSLEMSVKAYEKTIPLLQKMADLKIKQGKDASAELAKIAAMRQAIPAFRQAAALLAQADEALARVALEEVKALTPPRNGHDFSKHLANAEKEFLSGQSEAAEGDCTKAILEYKHSWILSKQADHTHRGDNDWIKGIDQRDPDTGCGDDKKR